MALVPYSSEPSSHQNHVTPLTVPIKLKVGTKKNSLRGLESLHNQLVEVDVEMTWVDAFAYHFDAYVNPDKYFIQRGTNTSTNGIRVGRHFLTEKIKVLLSEYSMNRLSSISRDFLVTIISKNSRVKNVGVTPNGLRPKGTTRTTHRNNPGKNKGRQQVQVQDDDDDDNDDTGPVEDSRTRRRSSNYTSSSQVEDSEELGIQWEDVQAQMLQKIKHDYRNSDFLRAREELRTLKDNGRWTRALMTLPSVLNIAQDLFDTE